MPFKTLYNRRQAEAEWLPLNWYVQDAHELQWVNGDIQIKRTTALPRTHLRGMIVQHKPHMMPHMLSCRYTIFLAAGLSQEMERLVAIKELMHLYFGPDGGGSYATDNAVVFENHINEMFGVSADVSSHQFAAEKLAWWMAISLLTSESARTNFQMQLLNNETTVDDVAAKLHAPIHTTKALLSRQYDSEISNIMTTF